MGCLIILALTQRVRVLAGSAVGGTWRNGLAEQQAAAPPHFDEIKLRNLAPSLGSGIDSRRRIWRPNVRAGDNTIVGRETEAAVCGHGSPHLPRAGTNGYNTGASARAPVQIDGADGRRNGCESNTLRDELSELDILRR
jgi:hypothetical protein